ncbi:MAG: hypothetical protein HY912_24540 [Desulfomonile tiedjei]|uniref:Uncharacterized protein n=1 Tax=Desulfomonile tiedjei TaxID=2358 RepID=A0A9D6V6V5_9BACT|nr:hypothetical protein [Desulfomonile tiedjei]
MWELCRHLGLQLFEYLVRQPRGYMMATKKLIAAIAVFLLISAPALALAGPKGFSGSRGSSAFKSRPSPSQGSSAVKPGEQGQPRTGTIQDLGVNPSTKSPADMVRNRPGTETPAGMPPGAGPAPQAAAPGFMGSGGFGSSWMTWGFLGYLFGRGHQTTQKPMEKELELIPDPVEYR